MSLPRNLSKFAASVASDGTIPTPDVTPAAVSDAANTSTGAFGLPTGTTAERPVSPQNGYTRLNTTTNSIEVYSSVASVWIPTSSLNLTLSSVEYLIAAGGGGGGRNYYNSGSYRGGGGGGAGGLKTSTSFAVSVGSTYTVTIGAGGAGGSSDTIGGCVGVNGNDSVFGSVTSTGGGGGGGHTSSANIAGKNGGSGGGASASTAPGTGISGQGFDGATGYSSSPYYGAGGGGGALSAGVQGGNTTGGAGGTPLTSSISGSSADYSAGGAGSGEPVNQPNATANTGNGGNGGNFATAGAGGSGVVIIRYADTYPAASATTGSPTITVAGGYRIYKWTASGSITF